MKMQARRICAPGAPTPRAWPPPLENLVRSVVAKAGLTLSLSVLTTLLVACSGQGDGGDGRSGSPASSTRDRLPPTLPDDFPLYPGLKIVDDLTLGDLYIVEATSQGRLQDVITFYEEELAKGRWEPLSTDSSPEEGTIFFTARGFSADGRVAVSRDKSKDGWVIVAIALPINALGGEKE